MGATKLLEIAVPGGTVAVEQAGEGIPIILLHGWAVDRRIWTPQVEALADRFRLIALDRRGFGASTAPPGLAKEIGDLLAILARLEIDRAVIVGMSQGGRVALRFAATHPKRARGLVLQGAPLDGFAPGPRGEDAIPIHLYRALVREGHIARMKDMWRRHPLMRVADPAARSLLDAVLDDYDGRDLLRPGPDAVTSLADSLAEVAVHSLVVTGEQDIAWRQLAGDALAYGLPHARRARLAGADHLCNLTHPERYNSLLALFVASTGEAEAQRQ